LARSSVTPGLQRADKLRPTDANRPLTIGVNLALRNEAQLEGFISQVSDRKSPNYGHYLTPEEFAATYGPTQAQVQQHHLGIGPDEAHLFQSLASRILYSDRTLRPPAEILARQTEGPAALWRHRISGDLPIVLVGVDEPDDVGIVRQLLRAHE